jgi:hypothetical protein
MEHPYIPQSIALEIKYIPASNTRCARVRVTCKRLGLNKTFSYDYSARGAYEQIEKALIDKGIVPSCVLDMGKTYILVIPWAFYDQVKAFLAK